MKVIVLGGSQFMGRLTVEGLLEAGHEVVLFNRGRTANPFEGRPGLSCVKCDRMGDRENFQALLSEQGSSDVVIDFVGFQEAYIQDTLEALTVPEVTGKKRFAVRHYIFVSTDSVNWAQKVPCTEVRLGEDDVHDFTPEEFEAHVEYCEQTSLGEYQLRYGGNKLGCERVLESAWREDGFPVTTLRMPDVYGPFDNLGGFWDLVSAIEARRPVPSRLQQGRVRGCEGEAATVASQARRFNWAFAEDVRDAILACIRKGADVHGVTLNVAHEETVHLHETCEMIADAMGLGHEALRYDDRRDAALPSTDYGALDVSRALRLLRPWRPTTMRAAVKRSVAWFLSSKANRRYHRMVHREARQYDQLGTRSFTCMTREVPSCWAGAPVAEKAAIVHGGPALLEDALPNFTGQAVLGFMQRLMDQAGELDVECELQRGAEVEKQTWALRYFAGHLLPQSEHTEAYRLEDTDAIARTDLVASLESPLGDTREDDQGQPPRRCLRFGGAGARPALRRRVAVNGSCGFWDCALLGRRKWRLFPPETPSAALCCAEGDAESPADCFSCGPEAPAVQVQHAGFAPAECWECEQTMGDAVVVPNGWWFQTYDDDRTLSISASYGGLLEEAEVATLQGVPSGFKPPRLGGDRAMAQAGDGPEVVEFELVD